MQVRDVMATNVVTVRENQTRQQAAQLLSQHRISGLPVVNDDNTVTGVVTVWTCRGGLYAAPLLLSCLRKMIL